MTGQVPGHPETPLETPQAGATTPSEPNLIVDKVNPHVLLVDDNIINLRLLETYLRTKRKYTRVESAQDGEQAVNAVVGAEECFDIIFMDISMPVMNGFEATRAIRQFETGKKADPGAMIIALTGLASGKDQTEVFDSGCDIYMTKPVSFKEVGKLLNHWEAHQNVTSPED
jgi:CheY-like chemotaxis protein